MIKEIITPLSPASLSSLGSPTEEQKQITEPAAAMPTVAAGPRRAAACIQPSLHGSHSQNVASELTEASPTKKAKYSWLQSESAQNHLDMMNYIERELAAAAAARTRSEGENAFSAFMAGINQLSLPPQQHEQPQFVHPQPFPQPQRQYPKPAPLTRAKQNKEDAKTLLSLIHTVELELDDENEIYDSCPELAQKIEKFLLIDGVNRKIFLEYGLFQKDNYVMLKSFLEGTNQSQYANKIYRPA